MMTRDEGLSFLNIIFCTGDEEHQSARPRELDVGSSDFEDRSFVKEEAQSQSESSFENGVEQEVDGSENDSGISAGGLFNVRS